MKTLVLLLKGTTKEACDLSIQACLHHSLIHATTCQCVHEFKAVLIEVWARGPTVKASPENVLEMQNFRIFRVDPRTKDLKGREVGPRYLSLNKSLIPLRLLKLRSLCCGAQVCCAVC